MAYCWASWGMTPPSTVCARFINRQRLNPQPPSVCLKSGDSTSTKHGNLCANLDNILLSFLSRYTGKKNYTLEILGGLGLQGTRRQDSPNILGFLSFHAMRLDLIIYKNQNVKVATIVAETMHNYLLYEHLLQVQLIPPQRVNRHYKPLDWVYIERKRRNKERTFEEHKKLLKPGTGRGRIYQSPPRRCKPCRRSRNTAAQHKLHYSSSLSRLYINYTKQVPPPIADLDNQTMTAQVDTVQMPVKTSKSESISKDMVRRGFRQEEFDAYLYVYEKLGPTSNNICIDAFTENHRDLLRTHIGPRTRELPRFLAQSYVYQTVILFKKPTSRLSKTFKIGGGHEATDYKPKECLKMLMRWLANDAL
ncbi:hypothetical protein LXL04_003078 [Taraxacum kok-saghyz]